MTVTTTAPRLIRVRCCRLRRKRTEPAVGEIKENMIVRKCNTLIWESHAVDLLSTYSLPFPALVCNWKVYIGQVLKWVCWLPSHTQPSCAEMLPLTHITAMYKSGYVDKASRTWWARYQNLIRMVHMLHYCFQHSTFKDIFWCFDFIIKAIPTLWSSVRKCFATLHRFKVGHYHTSICC